MENQVRVRFAPSPTGYLHVGGLRTALYNYLFARHHGGKFILRIEDTDRSRYVEGAVENLIASLKWAGLEYDEGPDKPGEFGPYVQSERTALYLKHADELIASGKAYYCFCTAMRLDEQRTIQKEKNLSTMYDKKCLSLTPDEVKAKLDGGDPYVIRLNIPASGEFKFKDKVRGKIKIDLSQVDDQILIKSDGFPTYHLANVVDDHYMQITHVIRGEEWLSSVPKHVLLYKYLGWKVPDFAHLPLLLNTDKSKLSKRQADVATEDYMKKGYLPAALINFVALLGWNKGDNQEIFSLAELAEYFDLKRVNKAGAVFDIVKLDWMNGQYIRKADLEWVCTQTTKYFEKANIDISDAEKYNKVINTARGYIDSLDNIVEHARMYYQDLVFDEAQKEILGSADSQKVFQYLLAQLSNLSTIDSEEIEKIIKQGPADTGVKGKAYFFPLRLVFYGNTSGPHVPTLIDILGLAESLQRIKNVMI